MRLTPPFNSLKHGFSLVELMVVMALIAILASVVYANFSGGGAKSRDVERQSELRQLQVAIEQYKQKNGRYPDMGTDTNGDGYASEAENTNYIVGLAPEFISRLPKDPRRGGAEGYSYTTNTVGSVYKVAVINSVEVLPVTYQHPFKYCDIRVDSDSSGALVSGSKDREVIGWCGRSDAGNLPVTCRANTSPFRSSYALWGGFAPKIAADSPCGSDTTPNCNPVAVRDTTDIICI